MLFAWILSWTGLLVGAALGGYALLAPRRVAKSLGIAFDSEVAGGMGEGRAFGGFILGAQLLALVLVSLALAEAFGWRRGVLAQTTALVLIAPASFVWLSAGLARVASILIDKDGTALNWRLASIDFTLALMIAMPLATLFVR